MATTYHVPGPVQISTGTGSAGALQLLGLTEDGVDLSIDTAMEPLMSDVAGVSKPADLQDMGDDATIRVPLVTYDSTVLEVLRKRGGSASGVSGARGALMGTGGIAFRLLLNSADEPWNFFTAILRNAQEVKLGTKYSVWRLTFYAWVFVPAGNTTPAGLKLYDRSTS